MHSSSPMRANAHRAVERLLLAITLTSYAYFAQAGGWNHNSRFDVARSIVEYHTLAIDAFHDNTGDLAANDGHYYSDKAPLAGVVAALPYAVVALVRPLFAEEATFARFASYVVTLVVSGGSAALIVLCLFRFAIAKGASPRAAASVALAFGLGSFAFPYATVLFGHDLAAACLFGAFYVGASGDSRRRMFLAGLFASFAVVAEYPTAGASAILGIYFLWSRGWRAIVPFAAGVVLPAAFGMLYARISFGHVSSVGYAHVVVGTINTVGNFGISFPHLDAIWGLLFGLDRGLFIGAPVLVLFVMARRLRSGDSWAIACACICVYYVLFIASYRWWDGGAAFGPRHLVPMLPFLCLAGISAAERWPRIYFGLAVTSGLLMLAGTARGVVLGAPVLSTVTAAIEGNVAEWGIPGLFAQGEATNLGLLLGLPGVVSLVPLLAMWAVLGVLLWMHADRQTSAVPLK